MSSHGAVRIGISGWKYKPWRGVFYPEKLVHKRELAFSSSIFRSIEINGTFYSLQRPETFERWAKETPDDFVFSVKGSRYITHMKRLRNVKVPLANFLASGLLRLGPKLGPILWQFPPNFHFKPQIFEAFLKLLPRDTEAASAIARRHDQRVSGRSALRTDTKRPLRHAVEIRHPTFLTPSFVELLRKYDTALVCADTVEWPQVMDLTSDFVYCRLHGSEVLYASGYDADALDHWAVRVAAWANGREPADAERIINKNGPKRAARDVYLYFDNDAKVRAPFDARGLIARLAQLLPGANLKVPSFG